MRHPFGESDNQQLAYALAGDTEPAFSAVNPIVWLPQEEGPDIDEAGLDQDQVATLRLVKAAVEFVGANRDVEQDIATCVAPESVSRVRSEIPVAEPYDGPPISE